MDKLGEDAGDLHVRRKGREKGHSCFESFIYELGRKRKKSSETIHGVLMMSCCLGGWMTSLEEEEVDNLHTGAKGR